MENDKKLQELINQENEDFNSVNRKLYKCLDSEIVNRKSIKRH